MPKGLKDDRSPHKQAPSLSEKFEQQKKRLQINQFLDKAKKVGDNVARSGSPAPDKTLAMVDNITKAKPPEMASPGRSSISLADITIAAAAAKTVKLKSKGEAQVHF